MPMGLKDSILSYVAAMRASRTPAWVYAVTLLPSCAMVALLTFQPWVPLDQLVRDPVAASEDCIRAAGTLARARDCANVYFGFLSNLGILLWCASAAVSLFAFLQVYHASGRFRPGAFLLYAGIFTGALLMDDLFLGHERVYPTVFGVDEELTYALYAVLFGLYLVAFRDDLLKCDPKILLLGIVLFALSLLMDELVKIEGLFENNSVFHRVAEDGSKFVAINAWTVFHVRAAWLTRERLGLRTAGPSPP